MKMERAGLIEIGARAAEIVEAIFFKKAADFGCPIGWSFRGAHPAIGLRHEVAGHGYGFDFKSGIAENHEHFAQRERASVGGITENFEFVLVRGAAGMFAGNHVFNQNRAVAAADPDHFRQDRGWILEMVKGEAADNHVKFVAGERKMLDVTMAKMEIGNVAFVAARFGNGEHGIGKVDADDLAGDFGEGFSDVAGAGRDVEDAFCARAMGGSNQSGNAFLVRSPGLRGEGVALLGKRLLYAFVVLGHDS